MGACPPELQMTEEQGVHGNVEDIVERRMFLKPPQPHLPVFSQRAHRRTCAITPQYPSQPTRCCGTGFVRHCSSESLGKHHICSPIRKRTGHSDGARLPAHKLNLALSGAAFPKCRASIDDREGQTQSLLKRPTPIQSKRRAIARAKQEQRNNAATLRSSTPTAPIRAAGRSLSATRRSTCLFAQRLSNGEC